MKINLPTQLLLLFPVVASAYSTSPNPVLTNAVSKSARTESVANASQPITFSEFPDGTSITDQYNNIGILFGSGSFITDDSANPTSPVLSGTPRFQGDITGNFVNPTTGKPTQVKSFTFDAGYFDEIGSTRVEWFDPEGKKLGQKINSGYGIEQLTSEGGNIASWKIGVVANEPAGFAIDNVSFVPVTSSILFRERIDSAKEGTWGFAGDEILGFDHVGFHIESEVYESHPGNGTGTFVSADGKESVSITQINGVQSQHSRATFEHDSQTPSTPVVDFEEIPIAEELATKMRDAIETRRGATFAFIDFSFPDGLAATLSPAVQKGSNNTFTCVGLVEWAAEQAGQNGGEGFIKNNFESFSVLDPREITYPPKYIEVPLLSPQLLNYAMKGQNLLQDANQWLQGFLDPVDFILTDPLGRKLGFNQSSGYFNEIPNAFYSGDGGVEQFLIPNAIPGLYTMELKGVNDSVFAAMGADGSSDSFTKFMANGETEARNMFVKPKAGTGGDVDGNGCVNEQDIQELSLQLNHFTDGLGNAGDINGDGLLSTADLSLLTDLVNTLNNQPPVADAGINQTVKFGTKVVLNGNSSYSKCPATLTYSWSQIGGPNVTLDNQAGISPSFLPKVPGAYTFNLSVSDDTTTSPLDTVTITVEDVPVALFSPNGGEVWKVKTVNSILWYVSSTLANLNKPIKIQMSKNDGKKWTTLKKLKKDKATTGVWQWNPKLNKRTLQARIRICLAPVTKKAKPICDYSDASFIIEK